MTSPILPIPRVAIPDIVVRKDYKMADTFYEDLRDHITALEKELKEGEQLEMLYYGFPDCPIVVTDMGYHNPNLIVFYGKDSQHNECSVLVHMDSVQLLLRVTRAQADSDKRPIGFLK